jgi:hypothetical protein
MADETRAILQARAIRDAATRIFLETGRDSTAAELAEALGWSVSRVRSVVQKNHGSVPGLHPRRESRVTYSRMYPGFESGSHTVWVYGPTREHLRDLINLVTT